MSRTETTVGIVGLGLIGGSFAKALKYRASHRVLGWDINPDTMSAVLSDGSVDGVLTPEQLPECNFLIVGLYPHDTVDYLLAQLPLLAPGTIVADLCGVKRFVCEALTEPCRAAGVTFIGAHPMAGRHFWGYSHSDAHLFEGASILITPDPSTPKPAVEALSQLFAEAGFGRVIPTTPDNHDRMIAFTSQLAHLVSNGYVKSPSSRRHSGYTGGSFQDLTRVAKLNEEMWSELFLLDRDHLLEELDCLIGHLAEYRDALAAEDRPELTRLLREGREIKEEITQ